MRAWSDADLGELISQVSYHDAWAARCQVDFRFFSREAWPLIERENPLVWNWHLDWICEAMEALKSGSIRNLLLCMPPRHLKSTFGSVLFPAWVWLTDPQTRWLTGSYARRLATRDSVRSRRVISHPTYRLMRLPACLWELSGDQNQKERYENTEGGWRIISSVESGTTGEGGDYVTVDDAHDAAKVESDLERSAAHEWWFRVMSTRLDHPKTGRKLAIMQRTHVDDVAGAIKERGGYEVIELKTLYECDAPGRRTVQALGLEDPRTDEGELLCEAHFGHAEVQQAQKDLGTQGFAAQHQQSPVPREGGIIKREWLRRWSILPAKFDYTFHSWDLKFGGKTREQLMRLKNPSWVHGAWFGKKGASLYLVGERRARVGFLESIGLISAMVEDDPGARKIIVEDKADGPATIEVLQGEIANVVAWDPRRASKIQRAETAAPFIEGGGLYVPSDAHGEWVEEWIEEVTTFPFARDADRVDTLTQAVLSECRAQDQTAIKKMKALARF